MVPKTVAGKPTYPKPTSCDFLQVYFLNLFYILPILLIFIICPSSGPALVRVYYIYKSMNLTQTNREKNKGVYNNGTGTKGKKYSWAWQGSRTRNWRVACSTSVSTWYFVLAPLWLCASSSFFLFEILLWSCSYVISLPP